MKRLVIWVLIPLLGVFLVCCEDELGTDDGDECQQGQQRCLDGMIQNCEDGIWIDWTNCNAIGYQCIAVDGVAECVGGGPDIDTDVDTDVDTDTDTDSDVDTDTDSDTDSDGDWDMYEDFESYNAGDYIVATAGYPWVTFSDPSLPGEDAQVMDTNSYSGYNSLYIVNGNDVVWMTELDSGRWLVEFEMYIEKDKIGYYNFQQVFDPAGAANIWAFEMYFYSGGVGNCVIAGKQYPFKFKDGMWFTASHDIDIDSDVATITIDGWEVYTWPWSTAQGKPPGNLDGINFYGISDPPGSGCWIDDVRYMEL